MTDIFLMNSLSFISLASRSQDVGPVLERGVHGDGRGGGRSLGGRLEGTSVIHSLDAGMGLVPAHHLVELGLGPAVVVVEGVIQEVGEVMRDDVAAVRRVAAVIWC